MIALIVAIAGFGCAPNDLGTPCHLLRGDNSEADPRPGHAVLHSGSGECEQFACVSYGGSAPRCSRPCDQAGDSCEGGMTCMSVVLDPELIEAARSRMEGKDEDGDGRDDFEQHLASLTDSLYCVMVR